MKNRMIDKIKKLIKDRQFKIGIIGMGYVGLPLAVEFANKGFETTGFEIDEDRVKDINSGQSYVLDVTSESVKRLVNTGKLKASLDFSLIRQQNAIIICVPTPLRKSKDPDVSYIISAVKEVQRFIRKGQVIVLESTSYPGTTKELVKPVLEKSGLKSGKDFYLAFSPERVDPGNKIYKICNTPKVVGGIDTDSAEISAFLYAQIIDKVIKVSNSETAEIIKLLENTFRAVNIAMINEMALMCHKLGIDVWEVIDAASSKPFGFMPFYPGPGIGGHCIPLDPHYLGWKMKMLNFEPRFIELAGAINSSMPEHIVSRISEILNVHAKTLKSSKLLIIGMAYKPDISDERESPAKDIFVLLKKSLADVDYYDPYIPRVEIGNKVYKSIKLNKKALKKYDCVIIITQHSNIDYRELVKNSKFVFDARNATKGIVADNIYKL